MAMNANPGGPDDEGLWGEGEGEEVLACGRPLSSVWAEWDAEEGGDGEAAADPSAPAEAHHPRDCPYCQAARERLLLLNGYVSRLRTADAEEEARGTDVAASVTARVMDMVRAELRPGRTLPLGTDEEDVWMIETAAARTFRSAAEALPGVRAGSCRVEPWSPTGEAEAGEAGPRRGPVRVRLEVAAAFSWTVPELAEAVRARVLGAADEELGMDVSAVDVRVVDLYDDDAPSDPDPDPDPDPAPEPGPGAATREGGER